MDNIYTLNSKELTDKPCELGSIPEIHKRLVANGYHVSEYLLRQLAKNGTLPHIQVGRRLMIYYSKTRDILSGENPILMTPSSNPRYCSPLQDSDLQDPVHI